MKEATSEGKLIWTLDDISTVVGAGFIDSQTLPSYEVTSTTFALFVKVLKF